MSPAVVEGERLLSSNVAEGRSLLTSTVAEGRSLSTSAVAEGDPFQPPILQQTVNQLRGLFTMVNGNVVELCNIRQHCNIYILYHGFIW